MNRQSDKYREELNSLDQKYAEQIMRLGKLREYCVKMYKAIRPGVMKSSLTGKGRLAEQVEAWMGRCAIVLYEDHLFKNLSSM